MKKNFKHLSFALLIWGLNIPAFADTEVVVPNQQGGFKVGIDALYLRPTSSDLDFATLITTPSDFSLGYENNAFIDPSYNLGAYIQLGYLFPCTGNDLTIGYTYFSGNSTSSIAAPPPTISGNVAVANGNVFIPPINAFAELIGFSSAKSELEYTLNVIDLEAGQRFTSGPYDLRMFAGLRYADIDSTLSTVALPYVLPPGILGPLNRFITGTQEFTSQLQGIGPRIGADARYSLSAGFGLDVNLSTALLVGNVDSDYTGTLRSTLSGTVSSLSAKNDSVTRVIPVLEAKLGVDYAYPLCSNQSLLMFEFGYQVTNYFNAADHHFRILGTPPANLGSIVSPDGPNDVAFDGLYLGVKYYA